MDFRTLDEPFIRQLQKLLDVYSDQAETSRMNLKNILTLENLRSDIPAGVVVFLVALPLCLGISLASGAPLISGLVTGIIGGTVTALISGSRLSVSGPAAGLTVIILNAIETLGSFELLLLAVILAGVLQVLFGLLRGGVIGLFFPAPVIKGMLAAIGLLLIIKQAGIFVGYSGGESGGEGNFYYGAMAAGIAALFVLIVWELPGIKKTTAGKLIPGALLAVIAGVAVHLLLPVFFPSSVIPANFMVNLPSIGSLGELTSILSFPDFGAFSNPDIYLVAGTIAIIASLETLLSVDAVDRLDPGRKTSPRNRELIAQGAGNILAGFAGGLPMTAVIVRSSANVNAGGKTKISVVLHALLLILALSAFPGLLNMIPLPALAAILIFTGFKLCHPKLFSEYKKQGIQQLAPFMVTIIAILLTDLLVGIIIGMTVSMFFLLRKKFSRRAFHVKVGRHNGKRALKIKLRETVTFLNKPALLATFNRLPQHVPVVVDGSEAKHIDREVLEIIRDYCDKPGRLNARYLLLRIPTNPN